MKSIALSFIMIVPQIALGEFVASPHTWWQRVAACVVAGAITGVALNRLIETECRDAA